MKTYECAGLTPFCPIVRMALEPKPLPEILIIEREMKTL